MRHCSTQHALEQLLKLSHINCHDRSVSGLLSPLLHAAGLARCLPALRQRLCAGSRQPWEYTCQSEIGSKPAAARWASLPPPRVPPPCLDSALPCVLHRLLYWTAADGAARREAYDALADAIACLGSSAAATERWSAQAAALRRVAGRGADDLPSARAAGGEAVSLHRVSISDEPDQLFLLSK